jgi:hypothetical protein
MKPLLVGEAPGPNGDPEKPLEGRPAMRLAKCMGFAEEINYDSKIAAARLRDLFDVRNLLDRPMERVEGSKGTEWPAQEAGEAAKRLSLLIEKEQPVVFLGKRVAGAFMVPIDGWWTWTRQWSGGDARDGEGETPWALLNYVTVPHPSGIVRLWNDPVTGVRTGYALYQALGKVPR